MKLRTPPPPPNPNDPKLKPISFENLTPSNTTSGGRISYSPTTIRRILSFCAQHQLCRHNRPSPRLYLYLLDEVLQLDNRDLEFYGIVAGRVLGFIARRTDGLKDVGLILGGKQNGVDEWARKGRMACRWAKVTEGWWPEEEWDGDCNSSILRREDRILKNRKGDTGKTIEVKRKMMKWRDPPTTRFGRNLSDVKLVEAVMEIKTYQRKGGEVPMGLSIVYSGDEDETDGSEEEDEEEEEEEDSAEFTDGDGDQSGSCDEEEEVGSESDYSAKDIPIQDQDNENENEEQSSSSASEEEASSDEKNDNEADIPDSNIEEVESPHTSDNELAFPEIPNHPAISTILSSAWTNPKTKRSIIYTLRWTDGTKSSAPYLDLQGHPDIDGLMIKFHRKNPDAAGPPKGWTGTA